jgi:hypothetical protein
MADWAVALIGVGGTAIGALLSNWTTRMSVSREDARRRDDRQWSNTHDVYEGLLQWVGDTDEHVTDIHYAYTQYRSSGSIAPTGGEPIVSAVKQAEYRRIVPPDQWSLPDRIPESTRVHLAIFGSPEAIGLSTDAERTSVRVADEAMSLGRAAIGAGFDPDAVRADEVINGFYDSWLETTTRLKNQIRSELAPGSKPL